jgi:SAM-dependent methyltransferase
MAFLEEPRLRGVEAGSSRFFELQRQIIHERPLMRGVYDLWYRQLLQDERSVPGDPEAGGLLELGSGGSYLKAICPRVTTSDVVEGVAERVIDGRELPFDDQSLRAIFLVHVFHHIPDVEAFLREAERALVPGGVIAMIEVPHTPLARFFFDRFHPEPYDDGVNEWAFDQNDAMMDANQALSWIVFFRDRERLERSLPGLALEQVRFLPWLSYLLSGGVTRRNLVPGFLVPFVRGADRLFEPLDRLMALHWHLRIRKRSGPG